MATTASLSSSNMPDHVQKHITLLTATVAGHETRVRELLASEKWTSPADHDTLRQALTKAATKCGPSTVRLLLDAGADVHPRKDKDISALFKAAEANKITIVEQLLEHKANPNWRQPKTGHTALCSAVLRGHTDVVKALLGAGAHPDGGQDKNGKRGASDGRTPLLLLASEKSSKWNLNIVNLLLQWGADPNLRDSTRRSPLHWTATNGLLDFARCLLHGASGIKADPNAAQNRGKTALHLASALNRVDFVVLLLENGAYVDATSDGRWTPLINAAEKGHEDVVAKLLAAGANVNAELSNHMTALHWASSNGHEAVVKQLLERPEAKLNRKDQFERTPMICAAEKRDINIVQLLSPARHAHRLSESAREASKKFEATIVDFGEFQEERYLKDTVKEKKLQLVFKHTVYDLLYGLDEKTGKATVPVLTKNIKWQPHFRWIHLPANNVAWIETLLAKSFVESGTRDVEGFKALSKCFDQEYRGPLAHAKFMRPYCKRIPNERVEREDSSSLGSVMEQPIDYNGGPSQTNGSRSGPDQPEHHVGKSETKKKSRSEKVNERNPTQRPKRNKGHPGNPPGTKEAKLQSRQSSFASSEAFKQLVNHGKMVLFMPFLHYETDSRRQKMTDTIEKAREGYPPSVNASRDELLIHAYMNNHLHPRRTLDQFFYHGIDTSKRDIDQVVYRYCRDYRKPEEIKLFMVDQLWMWILGGDTVITCFPQRWDQPKQDPLNMVDGIIEETNAKTRVRIQSVYDLAMVITGRCAGMFDRHRIDEQQYQFLDMFESSIGNVTDRESQLFSKFNKASEKAMAWLKYARRNNDDQYDEKFADDLLNIHSETMLLAEIKDIQDELNIIDEVLRLQSSVLGKLQLNIEQELRVEGNRKITDLVLRDIKYRYQEQMRLITERHDDIERMCEQSSGIALSLTNLLDLKQKHSNALEARFAREQAIIAAKQGQTIMVFTIVTIIFLPMSFIAAFFAINLEDWGDRLTIGYVSKYMFGIGLAVSFVFVAAAFLVEDISTVWKTIVRLSKRHFGRLFSRSHSKDHLHYQQAPHTAISGLQRLATTTYNEKPGTAGGASTACHSISESVEARSRSMHAPNGYPTSAPAPPRMSLERGRYAHNHQTRLSGAAAAAAAARSPMRYGGGGGGRGSRERAPWSRVSFDGRRGRFSGDLERGRERSRSRVRWDPDHEYEE